MPKKLARILPFAVLLACVFSLPGGAAPAGNADAERLAKVVARVGDVTITVGEIEERLSKHMRPGMFEDPEKMKELVDSMVDRELLVMEAKKRGLDQGERVQDHMKRILYNQIQTKYVAEKLPLESITTEEISAYYAEHESEYNQPTLVRAYQILVKDRAAAEAILAEVKMEGMDLRKFKVIAGEKSEDEETRKRGGDLRYFDAGGKVWTTEETIPKAVADAAFGVEIFTRASAIVTSDPLKAKEAHDKAMMPGLSDASFKKLVTTYSTDAATKAKAGDLGFFNLEGEAEGAAVGSDAAVPMDVARAAFSLRDPGTVYPKVLKIAEDSYWVLRVTDRKDPGNLHESLIQTDLGFHVLWVVNRRPSVHKSVEEMEPSIRQRLWQDKKKEFMDKLIADLKQKHEVELHYELLEKVAIDLTGQAAGTQSGTHPPVVAPPGPMEAPPALPGGQAITPPVVPPAPSAKP